MPAIKGRAAPDQLCRGLLNIYIETGKGPKAVEDILLGICVYEKNPKDMYGYRPVALTSHLTKTM